MKISNILTNLHRSARTPLRVIAPLAVIAATIVAQVPTAVAAETVTVTNPTPGSVLVGTHVLQAEASGSVVGVRFKLNGGNLGPEDLVAPYSYTWDTSQNVNNVDHNITATARYSNGSKITSAPVTVRLYNPAFPGTVAVLGDSVSQQAFDPDANDVQTFTAGAPPANLRNINVKMGWGAGTPNVQQHATNLAIFRWPETLVVALGANDASPLWGADGWTEADLQNFRTLINAPHVNSCVVLVLPFNTPDTDIAWGPQWGQQISEARADLTALATERPNTIVVDWAPIVAEHPGYMDEDGIHLKTDTSIQDDLEDAAEGRLNPVHQDAADARQEFYWSSAAQCTPQP